jgi:hypothetical protein
MVRLHSAALKTAGFEQGQLAKTSNPQPDPLGGLSEISIPSDEDNFLVTEFERGREVDRVIATQPQAFGIATGAHGELLVDPDRSQLRVELLEARKRLVVLPFVKTIHASGSRQSRPALRGGKDA